MQPLKMLKERQNWLNLKGIGPTYMDKTGRNGLRIGDIELPTLNHGTLNFKQT